MERLDENESDESAKAWEGVCCEADRTLVLTGPEGKAVAEFLLHIQGDRAWFRWSDTPFSEEGLQEGLQGGFRGPPGARTASMWMGVEDHRVTRDNQGVGALRDGGADAHEPTHGRA